MFRMDAGTEQLSTTANLSRRRSSFGDMDVIDRVDGLGDHAVERRQRIVHARLTLSGSAGRYGFICCWPRTTSTEQSAWRRIGRPCGPTNWVTRRASPLPITTS